MDSASISVFPYFGKSGGCDILKINGFILFKICREIKFCFTSFNKDVDYVNSLKP